ncbi:Eosinophil peroxidase [Gracilariopsis chorda]|uniref:Eosinophil peroxidase n=1 Tax=Gracilariopsis chorda TaxID=448386 RepID=A0A2V3IF87_9FLOR|nr:Eosinophil peroxidase [Gracilariopsis chorda]|eukprot:PXF40711.1 Eosinophil peroxidase [Gracilariopsis chorda]
MARIQAITALFFTLLAFVAAQAPKPSGVGSDNIKPLPPAKDPNAVGVAEECTGIDIRTLSGKCTSAVDPSLGEARRAQFSYFDVNTVEFEDGNLRSRAPFPTSDPREEEPIEVPEGDPDLDKRELEFVRSMRAPVNDSTSVERPITVLSSALDLSNVYGVEEERNQFLRVANSCRLKTSRGNLLPFNTGNFVNTPNTSPAFFIAGDTRASETPMLTAMHTTWVREHNRICDLLEDAFPNFEAEKQYETARAINIAQYQKIIYEEWLPAILGSTLPAYTGYKKEVNPTVSLEFTTAAFRLGHTLVGEDVTRIDSRGNELPPRPAEDMFFVRSEEISAEELENFIRGGATTSAQEVDEKVVDTLRNFLFENVEEEEGFDLIALNLQRSRDHHVAKFNELRELFLGSRASSFAQISSNPTTARNLELAYGNVDNVEAWIGLMAEDKNRGVGVGRTLESLLKTEFTRLRDGDQFFYLLRNQLPTEVLNGLPRVRNDIFGNRPLFNRILRRTTRIGARFLPSGRNAFRV